MLLDAILDVVQCLVIIGAIMYGIVTIVSLFAKYSVIWLIIVIMSGVLSYGMMIIIYLCLTKGQYYEVMRKMLKKLHIIKST